MTSRDLTPDETRRAVEGSLSQEMMASLSCEADAGYGPCGTWQTWTLGDDGALRCECGHLIQSAQWDTCATCGEGR